MILNGGDEEAFRDFVSSRMDGWRRAAYAFCGNWHTAEDLVSITLTKVLRHWATVAATGNPDSYVRRILIRTAIDEHRRTWRESPMGILPEQRSTSREPGQRNASRGPEACSASRGPEAVVDRQEVVGMLRMLPPAKREVMVLRYVYDLSVEETAARLGCSLGNVKSQTARALAALRVHLK
ncbi:SigE family RNA polymerase sigma factor [Actinoplanes sp. NPDC023936]|uniref:RNA polymerase sigma factor n=1 Tax=Actinoplanes sp. NPDC023936 TaxID=3154910 RepID=UPI0033F08CFE